MTLDLSQHVGQNVALTCRGGIGIQGTLQRLPDSPCAGWPYVLKDGPGFLSWNQQGKFDPLQTAMDVVSVDVIEFYLPDYQNRESVVTLRKGLVIRGYIIRSPESDPWETFWQIDGLRGYQWNCFGRVRLDAPLEDDIVAIELAGARMPRPTPPPSLQDSLKEHHGRLVVLTLRGGVLMVGTLDAGGRGTYTVELLVRGHETGRLLWTATGGWKAFSTSPDPQDIVAVQAVTALGNEPFDHVVDRLLLHSADAP